jgi:hypothetical protein
MHRLAIAGVAALLAACVTALGPTGPTFAEHASGAAAVAPEMARLYVFWPEPLGPQDMAIKLGIDGSSLGACERGGFNAFDVPAGAHVLSVVVEYQPGRCDMPVAVSGGSTYYYELKTRAEFANAALPGAVLLSIPVPPITALGLIMMYGGMAIESSGKECGGQFALTPAEETAALAKISRLKKSR